MTEKLLKTYDEKGDTEFINKYQSTLEKIKSLFNEKNLESMRIYLEIFDKISNELITKYINSVNRCDVKSIKDKIHIELKNMVIDKYIKTVVNQEKQITKQNQEINAIKKMFENLIFKKYLQDDKSNEINNISVHSQLSPKSEQKRIINNNKIQETVSSINISLLKEKDNKKTKKEIKSVESRRLKLLDIEAERIMNEFPTRSNKISQSPIHTDEKYISYSSKTNDKERNSEKLSKVSHSPSKISRASSKENMGKKDLANKPRNVNKFINITSVNNSMKINSSDKNLGKPLKTATNRPVTPSETLSSSSGFSMNDVKKANSPIYKKKNINFNGDCDKKNDAQDSRRSNLSPNKQSTKISKEKNTKNYSKNMFNKHYEMLDSYRKKSRGNDNSPDKIKEKDHSIDKRSIIPKNSSLSMKNSLISRPKY